MEESGRGPTDNAKIKVDPDGAVELITGGASLGQGFETAMAQICAEALGVDYQRVRVHPRPDRPHRPRHRRARRARDRAYRRRRARHRHHGAREGTRIRVRAAADAGRRSRHRRRHRDAARGNGRSGPSISLADIAKRIAPGSKLLRGREPQLGGAWLVQHRPHGVSLRRPSRRGARRSRHRQDRRSSASWWPMTSAARSIR